MKIIGENSIMTMNTAAMHPATTDSTIHRFHFQERRTEMPFFISGGTGEYRKSKKENYQLMFLALTPSVTSSERN